LDPSVKAWIDALWADEDRDEEEVTDAYHDKLESLGL
ncbi:siderophore-interacting protein, partial [Actinotalea fermentans ATCC 43279 = JCM 9966 = DSM 3133]